MIAYIDFGNTAFKILPKHSSDEIRRFYYSRLDRNEVTDYFGALGINQGYYITSAKMKSDKVLKILNLDIELTEIKRGFVIPYLDVKCDIGTTGIDRLINVFYLQSVGKNPVLTIDAGTAVNIEIIDSAGSFIGGFIMSNPIDVTRELLNKAEGLTKFSDFFRNFNFADIPEIGDSTVTSISAGLFYQIVPGFKAILSKLEGKMGVLPRVIVTGGLGIVFYKILSHSGIKSRMEYEPALTLKGLRIFVETKWRK